MRVLAVILLSACVAHGARIRRQEDGNPWWLTTPETHIDSEHVVTSAPEETRHHAPARVPGTGNVPAPVHVPAPTEDCLCVPYYLCKDGDIITDGTGLIDIRSGGKCPTFLEVCCKLPYEQEVTTLPYIPPPQTDQCGVRNRQGIHIRIQDDVQESSSQVGEFPWMAAILRQESINDKTINLYVCGGSLIRPGVILTAAHCVHNKDAYSLIARLGEWNTQNTKEPFPHQDIPVQEIIIHEGFHPQTLFNDFALLVLKNDAIISSYINTICLPDGQQLAPIDLHRCVATGWGKDNFKENGKYQNVLKNIELPVVDHYDCNAALKTTRLGHHFKLDQSFICAGGNPGQDTCQGDGGSPLICPINEHGSEYYVQVGIVAWGIGCGENGIPGVYADVSKAVYWIDEVLAAYPH